MSTVLWERSPWGGPDIVFLVRDKRGCYVATLFPSKIQWYQHFLTGCSVHMRDAVQQDQVYTIEVILTVI